MFTYLLTLASAGRREERERGWGCRVGWVGGWGVLGGGGSSVVFRYTEVDDDAETATETDNGRFCSSGG